MAPQIVDLSDPRIQPGNQIDAELVHTFSENEKAPPPPQDAFGDEEFAEVKYKVLKWWQGGMLMIAETISLGILTLPKAMASLGFVPGLIILVGLGIIATYTGYVIAQFKWRFPHISSMSDAGYQLLGPIGRELVGFAQILFLVFIMASHLVTFSVAMNTLTHHGTCSIVFGVVGLIASFICTLPRTLAKMTWLSVASFISILIAVFITMVAVGVRKSSDVIIHATAQPSLVTGVTAAANITFTYVTHNTFFSFIAEFEDPRDFPKALALLQTVDISLYIVTAVVIYYFTGNNVTSPALGSAGPLIAKIAYGIALPTIIIAGVMNAHIAAKTIYLRVFAGTDRIHKRDLVATGSWIGIGLALWIVAWIIASAIPVFDDLLSLMTSLFATWFTFTLPGMFWFYMNRDVWFSSLRKLCLTLLNTFIICIGLLLCGLGVYASGKAIHDDASSDSFSCADNS
ncbi:hypothetical protein AWENTII_006416 [Aspergillus wentii]